MLSTGRSPNPRSRTLCRCQWSPNCPQSHLLSPRMWHPWRGSRCMGRSNSWKSYSILLLSQLNIGNVGIHSLGSMSSMLDFGHVRSAWLCPLVLESKTYRWNGENDDHIRFLEVLWWLNHCSFKSQNQPYDTGEIQKPWFFTIFHPLSSIFHPFFINEHWSLAGCHPIGSSGHWGRSLYPHCTVGTQFSRAEACHEEQMGTGSETFP